jgi:hypothetical protein
MTTNCTPDPYERFCRIRRADNLAFFDWLRTDRPDPDLAREEIEGGVSAQRQLLRLWLSGDVP